MRTTASYRSLVAGGDAPLVILVPANTERHLLVDFLENLSMLDIAKAFRELMAHSPNPAVERAEAADTLAASLAALAVWAAVSQAIVEGKAVTAWLRRSGPQRRTGRGHHASARRAGYFPHRLGHQGTGQVGASRSSPVRGFGIYRRLVSVA